MNRHLLALLLLAMPVVAPAAPTDSLDGVRRYVEREAANAAAAASGIDGVRAEATLGTLEAQFARAPCARVEPFISPGVRLWGRSHVGVRCVEGADWSLQWPVTVRIFGPALVATRPLAAMQPISAADVRRAEGEWTRNPQGVATVMTQLESRVALHPIAAGQPVGLDAIREQMAVGQGDSVKLVAAGEGFSIVTEGTAMNAAAEGQPVRVRTESGRVLSGTAHGSRVVEVMF